MFFIRKKCEIYTEKSKQDLYLSNLRSFKNDGYVGRITEDEFKIYKRQFLRPRLFRRIIFQGVFVGKITETENGCKISLLSRVSHFFSTIITILFCTHILCPLFLWALLMILGTNEIFFLMFALLSSIILTVFLVLGYIAPAKGEEELVKNILALK